MQRRASEGKQVEYHLRDGILDQALEQLAQRHLHSGSSSKSQVAVAACKAPLVAGPPHQIPRAAIDAMKPASVAREHGTKQRKYAPGVLRGGNGGHSRTKQRKLSPEARHAHPR
jgi:hypothetical protein